jgi:menaquinone-dependent protoporphyrinogen oxidase
MSKVLVVYGTSSGCTQTLAEKVGETLAQSGADVEVVSAKAAPAAAGYDAIVVGSGVRAGQWHKPAKEWVAANAEALRSVPVALFTCGLMIRDGEDKAAEVRAFSKAIEDANGLTPVDVGLFAGWNDKHLSFPERAVMKLMKAAEGDFRDLGAVEAWSRKVAPQLGLAG